MFRNDKESVSAFFVYKQQKTKIRSPGHSPAKKIKVVNKKPKTDIAIREKTKVKCNKPKSRKAAVVGEVLKPKKQTETKVKDKKLKKSIKTALVNEKPPMLVPIKKSQNGLINKKTEAAEITELVSELNKSDPSPDGLKIFKWLIAPLNPSAFFEDYWESQVLHINRNQENYYSDILTTEKLDDIFREFPLYYTRNVDVVSYENGVKEVHNIDGKVVPAAIYDYYLNGCSIRVLNPQTYDQKVHLLLATLQEYFGNMVGANVYLTPADSQGFAPHYDDIEAFVIQLEGRKQWKLYKPKLHETLARDSSHNFNSEEIGDPFMEVTLNAGDLLYFPRGTIHEGKTFEDAHSLHITVSVYQHNSYIDLLEQALPVALKKAVQENVEFRKGLPINYLQHLGYVNKNRNSDIKKTVNKEIEKLMHTVINYIDIDDASDQLGRKFMYDSMPPVLSKHEARNTSKYDGDFMKNGRIFNRVEIEIDTEIRLLRYHCLRVLKEDDVARIYYNTDNSKTYHGEDEQFLVIDLELLPCIKKLQNCYPKFIRVEDLPLDDYLAKAQLVSDLWEKGLLVTNGPLNPLTDE